MVFVLMSLTVLRELQTELLTEQMKGRMIVEHLRIEHMIVLIQEVKVVLRTDTDKVETDPMIGLMTKVKTEIRIQDLLLLDPINTNRAQGVRIRANQIQNTIDLHLTDHRTKDRITDLQGIEEVVPHTIVLQAEAEAVDLQDPLEVVVVEEE